MLYECQRESTNFYFIDTELSVIAYKAEPLNEWFCRGLKLYNINGELISIIKEYDSFGKWWHKKKFNYEAELLNGLLFNAVSKGIFSVTLKSIGLTGELEIEYNKKNGLIKEDDNVVGTIKQDSYINNSRTKIKYEGNYSSDIIITFFLFPELGCFDIGLGDMVDW